MVGKTRNAVLGIIWRYKQRGGPPPKRKEMPSEEETRAELIANRGNVAATARKMGVSTRWIQRKIPNRPGNPYRKPNLANLELIAEIDASGLTDKHIADIVDMSYTNIINWRRGRTKPSPFLTQCVRSVLRDHNSLL